MSTSYAENRRAVPPVDYASPVSDDEPLSELESEVESDDEMMLLKLESSPMLDDMPPTPSPTPTRQASSSKRVKREPISDDDYAEDDDRESSVVESRPNKRARVVVPRELREGDDGKSFVCKNKECRKTFARRSDFMRHSRIHTNDRPFACTHKNCGKSFIQRSALTVHIRTHTGEKPHRCEVCQRAFSDSSSLARHRRIHTGKRPYKCNARYCGKTFCRKTTLTKHIERQHPEMDVTDQANSFQHSSCPDASSSPASDAVYAPPPARRPVWGVVRTLPSPSTIASRRAASNLPHIEIPSLNVLALAAPSPSRPPSHSSADSPPVGSQSDVDAGQHERAAVLAKYSILHSGTREFEVERGSARHGDREYGSPTSEPTGRSPSPEMQDVYRFTHHHRASLSAPPDLFSPTTTTTPIQPYHYAHPLQYRPTSYLARGHPTPVRATTVLPPATSSPLARSSFYTSTSTRVEQHYAGQGTRTELIPEAIASHSIDAIRSLYFPQTNYVGLSSRRPSVVYIDAHNQPVLATGGESYSQASDSYDEYALDESPYSAGPTSAYSSASVSSMHFYPSASTSTYEAPSTVEERYNQWIATDVRPLVHGIGARVLPPMTTTTHEYGSYAMTTEHESSYPHAPSRRASFGSSFTPPRRDFGSALPLAMPPLFAPSTSNLNPACSDHLHYATTTQQQQHDSRDAATERAKFLLDQSHSAAPVDYYRQAYGDTTSASGLAPSLAYVPFKFGSGLGY